MCGAKRSSKLSGSLFVALLGGLPPIPRDRGGGVVLHVFFDDYEVMKGRQ